MILDSMLSNSPVLLCLASGLLLLGYGAARLARAMLRLCRRALSGAADRFHLRLS